MRAKTNNNYRIAVIEFTAGDGSKLPPKTFIFNFIKNEKILRTVRLTLVDALGLFDDNSEMNMFHQFKWEELDLNDNRIINHSFYCSVQYVKQTICGWISEIEFIVGKDILVKLANDEIEKIWFHTIYRIHPDVILTASEDVLIIRNEI